MKIETLKKTAAIAVNAALLLTMPGLPAAHAAGDMLAAHVDAPSGAMAAPVPALNSVAPGPSLDMGADLAAPTASPATTEAGAAAAQAAGSFAIQAQQAATALGNDAAVKTMTSADQGVSDGDRLSAANAAFDKSGQAGDAAADQAGSLSYAQVEALRGEFVAALTKEEPALAKRVATGLGAGQVAVRTHSQEDDAEIRAFVARRFADRPGAFQFGVYDHLVAQSDGPAAPPPAEGHDVSKGTGSILPGKTAAVQAGVTTALTSAFLAVASLPASARDYMDRYGEQLADSEPSTYQWLMSTAQTYSPYAAGAFALMGAISIVSSIFFQVPQQHVYATKFWGKQYDIKGPGLKTKIPFFETISRRVSLQDQTEPLDFSAITSNQAVGTFHATLTIAVADANPETLYQAIYSFNSDAEFKTAIKSTVEGALRSFIAEKKQSDLLGLRDEYMAYLQEHLSKTMADWGYRIVGLQVASPKFDEKINASMTDVLTSQNKLKQAKLDAQTKITEAVRGAERDRDAMIREAQGESKAQTAEGRGVAKFRSEALQGAKAAVASGLSEEFVAYTLWLDAMEHLAEEGRGNVFLLNGSPAGIEGMQQQLARMLDAEKAAQKAADEGKDKAGSEVQGSSRSGIGGLWMLGIAATLLGFHFIGIPALVVGVGAAVAVGLASGAVFTVPEGHVYVMQRWSQFHGLKKAGLNFKVPLLDTISRDISIQKRTAQWKGFNATTHDQANLTYNATLIYKVKDDSAENIQKATYQTIDEASLASRLKADVEATIRGIINSKGQNEMLGLRQELTTLGKEHLDQKLAAYGYDVVDLQINDITFEGAASDSMSDVVVAENRNRAAANVAEADYVSGMADAEAKGQSTEIRAQGREEVSRLRGVGLRGFREEAGKGVKEAMAETGLSEAFVKLIMTIDALRTFVRNGKGNVIDLQDPTAAMGDAHVKKLLDVTLAGRAQQPAAAQDPK